jgi:MFS family permease
MIVSFYLAYVGLGNLLSGKILPYLIKKVNGKQFIIINFLILVIASSLFLFSFSNSKHYIAHAVALLTFMTLFSVGQNGLMSKITNIIMDEFESKNRASILSVHSMPGFLFTSIYSYYLIIYRNGAPDMYEGLISVIILGILGILISLVFIKDKNEK